MTRTEEDCGDWRARASVKKIFFPVLWIVAMWECRSFGLGMFVFQENLKI